MIKAILMAALNLFKRRALPAIELVVSKEDVDLIFSMRKAEWEEYVKRIAYPNMKVALKPMDTGTGVMAFDSASGSGLSIQPLFVDEIGVPGELTIGSYYPVGTLPAAVDEFQNRLQQLAKRDLGTFYSVSARYVKMSSSMEGVELSVTRTKPAGG